ncbi:MAG: ferrochelatase [Nitrospirota bacterium]|nr:ferrochelatase [Nitrospirota bacterium]
MKRSIGVLLLNLGGPDSLSAVQPFLYNLFSDREIIRLGPAFLQKPLAWLISSLRSAKTRAAYARIGGKSPIREITSAQAGALEKQLNSSTFGVQGSTFKVFVGMRYWQPFVGDTVRRMYEEGIRKVIVLTLYPHYSVATTGSSLSNLKNILAAYPEISIRSIESWYDHPLYIDALVESISRGLASFLSNIEPGTLNIERDIHLLFSAHSLPRKFVDEGDPYVDQIMATVKAVTARFSNPWKVSYQSKSGPVAWLEPSTEQMLGEMAAPGAKRLLVVPVSFVSDHIETLYEIDMLYKDMAAGLGMRLERAESLNLSPIFISALKDIVVHGIKEAGWSE